MFKSVTVYLGSSSGNNPCFAEAARELGKELAKSGISVVYGGACVGTMKALADGVLSEGGSITGVFPKGFKGKWENSSRGIEVHSSCDTTSIEVEDMSERKRVMEELGECCVALPGSYGTMDELFQYVIKLQLGFTRKPVFVLNLNGYYDPLKALILNMYNNGFIGERDLNIIGFCDSVEELLSSL